MKGAYGVIVLTAIVWVFWITYEIIKSKRNNKKTQKQDESF
jgi:hypothetical protein